MLEGSLVDASLFEVLLRAALPFFVLLTMVLVVLLAVDILGD